MNCILIRDVSELTWLQLENENFLSCIMFPVNVVHTGNYVVISKKWMKKYVFEFENEDKALDFLNSLNKEKI
jgi:hypothetical protein